MKLQELFIKYGDETIYTPSVDSPTKMDYRGYIAKLINVNGELQIIYDPELPSEDLQRRFGKCKTVNDFKFVIINAIDLAHEMQLQATGNPASAGEYGAGYGSGPLRRANG